MSARTYVIGVGMTKFDKPGTKEGDYPDWAKEAGEKALADAGHPLRRRRAGLRRLLLRRLHLRPARALPARPHRDPGRQRQQQLLDRLARRSSSPARRSSGGLADCALAIGFEKMEKGSLGVKYTDRTNALDKHAMRDVRAPRPGAVAAGAADVRQRRARPHGEVRLRARPLRLDRLEEPQALGQQPLRPVPGRVLARRDQGRADDPRAADQAPVLADLRRLGVRDRRLGALRRRARPLGPGDRDRRPGDGHRPLERPSPTTPTASRSSATTCRRQAADAGLRGGAGLAPTRSTSASCTTASRPTS